MLISFSNIIKISQLFFSKHFFPRRRRNRHLGRRSEISNRCS